MQRLERTATVDAPPDRVFAYLADLENLPKWQSGVVSAVASGDGPIEVGSEVRVVRELFGQRVEAPIRVTEVDRPHRIAVQSTVSGVRADATLDLKAAGTDGTEVRVTMEIHASGLTSFMEPMIASAAAGDLATSMDRLQAAFAKG
jgi:uncharacterized protein YndB with AHSA1/START domain